MTWWNNFKLWILLKFGRTKKKNPKKCFTPISVHVPKVEAQQTSRVPALGTLRDITMELDAEAQTLWKKREPFVK